jgi:hypothetical protein
VTATRIAILISAVSVTLSAQWVNYPTPGIPRTSDGKPNLSAPCAASARRQTGSVRNMGV